MVDEAWKSIEAALRRCMAKTAASIPPERLLPRVAAENVLHDPR
jgi:hypothetical protein